MKYPVRNTQFSQEVSMQSDPNEMTSRGSVSMNITMGLMINQVLFRTICSFVLHYNNKKA